MDPNAQGADSYVSIITQSLNDIWTQFLDNSPLIVAGLLFLVLTWVAARVVDFVLARFFVRVRLKRGFKDLIRQLVMVGVWVVGLMMSALIMFPSVKPVNLLAGLGLGSIAIGFAFKDIIENFLAGILILWRFPFDPGDWIRWGDIEGKVEEITVRMTLLRQSDGELVTLPNANLFKDPVHVLTHRSTRRVSITAGVAYGEDVDESREVIRRAVEGCKSVNKNQPLQIFAKEFGDSSIDFEVAWWTGALPLEVRRSRDEVVAAVKRGLDEAGIEIPFPYRTLTFKAPLRVEREERSGEGTRSDVE